VVIPLDNNRNDLWQGGPWEQPQPHFPPRADVPIPPPVKRPRPVLRTRKKRKKWPIFVAVTLLLAVLVGIGVGLRDQKPSGGGNPPSGPAQTEKFSTEPPAIPRAQTGLGLTLELHSPGGAELSYQEIYARCAPSLVSIEAGDATSYSTGTGIVLTADGYILTNAHVVAGADYVDVFFSDNRYREARLVGFDAREDLAVLKVEAEGLIPVVFGDSSALVPGEAVAAIGDPLGYRSTITDGIISALDREVEVDGITMSLIQTSAAINFGNSGGALINRYGQVVGVTTIKIVSEDGSAESLGFAIPSLRVKYVADALLAGEEVRPAVFGITVNTIPEEAGGLLVMEVHPLCDAFEQGLRSGDVLTHVDGTPVTGIEILTRAKLTRGPGDPVPITVLRSGEVLHMEIALADGIELNY